jgi:hypothetical protein
MLHRPNVPLLVFDSAGGAKEIGSVLGRPRVTRGTSFRGQPLGPTTLLAKWKEGVVLTFGTGAELNFLDSDGDLVDVVDTGRTPIPVTDQVISDWEADQRNLLRQSGLPVDRPMYPPGWIHFFPDSLPVYDRVVTDDRGCVWARVFRTPGDSLVSWDVIDPTTTSVATFRLHPKELITDVNEGLVIGIATDSLGVQRIVLWEVAYDRPSSNLRCSAGQPG